MILPGTPEWEERAKRRAEIKATRDRVYAEEKAAADKANAENLKRAKANEEEARRLLLLDAEARKKVIKEEIAKQLAEALAAAGIRKPSP